jgi:hypothetical protein
VFTVDEDSIKPPPKGTIRAHLEIGGWIFEPLPSDPLRTNCTFLVEIDLKGNIPRAIVNKGNLE